MWRGTLPLYVLDPQHTDALFETEYLPHLEALKKSGKMCLFRLPSLKETPSTAGSLNKVFAFLSKFSLPENDVFTKLDVLSKTPQPTRSTRTGTNFSIARECGLKRSNETLELSGYDAEMVDLMTRAQASNREEARSYQGRPDPEVLGGRSRFERMTQRAIIDRLTLAHRDELPKTMIIGDSIRMRISNGSGHAVHAYDRLVGKANLIHVPHNCGGSKVGRSFVDLWMQAAPDIVTYNCGLHDLTRTIDGVSTASSSRPEEYEENLCFIFERMRAAKVKCLIWKTLTPVDEEWHSVTKKGTEARRVYRLNADIATYNEIASRVAQKFDIDIIDFNALVHGAGVRACLVNDGVHLSTFGSRLLGHALADKIQSKLFDLN
ncbi:SGNH/GDSL hydrolase family protein [Octadecabacter sp.]|nr:SGNH/GDSL hydrolase family protein [Octadecabacter sp.]